MAIIIILSGFNHLTSIYKSVIYIVWCDVGASTAYDSIHLYISIIMINQFKN